jgi:hypothetical protein
MRRILTISRQITSTPGLRLAGLASALAALSACGAYDDQGNPLEDYDSLVASEPEQARYAEPVGEVALALTGDTAFVPDADGLKFWNPFKNILIPGLDITTGGLCGGMVYTALDYYWANKAVPLQDYPPTLGTSLRTHLRSRQETSIWNNVDKWAELGFNPFGARNDEFWQWGLLSQGRVAELLAEIDAGHPVPLGLQSCSECEPGNHQVLAIGYDTGSYSSVWKGYPNLKISVYDPNYPGETLTLRTNTSTRRWYYTERPERKWLTYLVDRNYSKATPPSHKSVTNGLVFRITTGGDDLRGGNDNLNIVVRLADGRSFRFDNANRSQRWINDSTEWVAVQLPSDVDPSSAETVTLETTFSGGLSGDNWNVDRLRVYDIDASQRGDERLDRSGDPLVRFTGSLKKRTYTLN